MVTIDKIKKLRRATGISLKDCQEALRQANGDLTKAVLILEQKGVQTALKKKERKIEAGIIETYLHPNKKIGVLLEMGCETDFVARSQEFQALAHELCLQIAAMSPGNQEELLEQPHIKDPQKKIRQLVEGEIAKLGENLVIKRFVRYEI